MSKIKFYRQCVLEKETSRQTSYIPETYAIKDQVLQLKENEVWEDGWKVIKVGPKVTADYVESNERNYLKTRKASDI